MIGQEAAGCDEFPRMEARRRRHHQPLTKLLQTNRGRFALFCCSGSNTKGSGSNTTQDPTPRAIIGCWRWHAVQSDHGFLFATFFLSSQHQVFCVASTCIRLPSWPPSTYFLNQVCYIRGVLELEHFCGNE